MTNASLVRAATIAALMVSFVLAGCGAVEESEGPPAEEPESTQTAETAAAKRSAATAPARAGGSDLDLGRDTPGPSGERSSASGNGFKRPPE